MKIICIGRNYVAHAHELNNDIPGEPVFFMKPDSALLRNNNPFYIPDWTLEVHHEIELVIKISRLGKKGLDPMQLAHRMLKDFTRGLFVEVNAGDGAELEKKAREISKTFNLRFQKKPGTLSVLRDTLKQALKSLPLQK